MHFLLAHAVAFAALALTAYVAGLALLGRWRLAPSPGTVGGELDAAALALPLGLAALAQVGLVLGLAGWLRPAPALAALAATHALAWRGWRHLLRQLRGALRRARPAAWSAAAGRMAGCALPAAVALAPFAVLSLYPPTAFDATLYHLPYAREFAARGAMPFLPALRYPIFPQLQEVLFTLVMLFADDVAAQGVTLLATLATALLLLAWAAGGAPEGRAVGWIAAAAFLGCPIVAALAGTGYVEPAMVMFGTAALLAWRRWRASPGGGIGWLLLAGVFAGSAAAVKYLGLLFVAGLALAATLAGPPAGRWRRLLATVAAAGLVMAPWYLRIVAATGNPLFPYFPGLFGASPWVAREFPDVAGLAAGARRGLLELLRLPWDMVLERERLGGLPPFSPLLVALLPALAVTAVVDRRTRGLLLLATAYAAVILAVLPEARYLLPLAPLLGLAAGEGIVRWLGREPLPDGVGGGVPAAHDFGRRFRRLVAGRGSACRQSRHSLLVAVAAVCLLPGWLYAAYRVARLGPVPLTAEERDRFLARELPAYAAVRYLNQAHGRAYTVYALHAENMAYFAAGGFLGDWSGPAAFRAVVPPDGDPAKLCRNLRGLGADHLLIVRGKTSPLAVDAPEFRRRFPAVYGGKDAEVFATGGCG